MASVNKVILVGNLGRDPETRYMPDGGAITNISIATTSQWKDKSGDAGPSLWTFFRYGADNGYCKEEQSLCY